MTRYSVTLINQAKLLRHYGNTFTEINHALEMSIPKATLSSWCKNTKLPSSYPQKLSDKNIANLKIARLTALKTNKAKRDEYLESIKALNAPVSLSIENYDTAKVALAMLCLDEASKSGRSASFYIGNSDHKIITLFLELLKQCFNFDIEKVRCTVQCRADQDTSELENYWMEITNIPKRLFYKSRIDPRTNNHPTLNKNYKGILRIDYFDNNIRLELESLANLIYNQVHKRAHSAVGSAPQWH